MNSDWNTLNETVSGSLIQAVPPGAVCYSSHPAFDQSACDLVLSNWTSSAFHAENPVSIDSNVWTNNSCNPIYPNGTSIAGDPNAGSKGCSLGAYPVFVINVTDVSDVQAALSFAQEHNVRLNIKNTGHNGAGRSIAYGSLSLWTHNLKEIQYHEQFQLQGWEKASNPQNESQLAATIGAGVQDGELFAAMAEHNAMAVGGTSLDVGVVGWSTGGGHGLMTGSYGMGADNIIQATVVVPTGEILVANEFQNQDVFWAIRGGGGGTFGVIVSMTVKVYPMPKPTLFAIDISAKNSTTSKAWWTVVAQFLEVMPQIQDRGVHGYFVIGTNPMSMAGSLFLWNANNATALNAIAPLKNFLSKAAADNIVDYSLPSLSFPTFYDVVTSLPATENVGRTTSITASRLITRDALRNQTLVAQVLEEVGPSTITKFNGTEQRSMSGTMTISRKDVDNALNPAWRDSVVHLISSQGWDDSTPQTEIDELTNDMTYNKLDALRQLDPKSGCYLNEANVFEPGWQSSFFGSNYARLRDIKLRYDPTGLLWCRQCVGSENWVEDESGKLCRSFSPY